MDNACSFALVRIAYRSISIVLVSLRRKSQEWDLHVIFQSRLRIDTFPEDFAKSTESNFSRVFKTRSPMGVNEEFSLSSFGPRIHSDGSIVFDAETPNVYIYIYVCGKLSRRETSALHLLRSFHMGVGEYERRRDRHCLLLKPPSTIITIIENRAFAVTNLWRVFAARAALFNYVKRKSLSRLRLTVPVNNYFIYIYWRDDILAKILSLQLDILTDGTQMSNNIMCEIIINRERHHIKYGSRCKMTYVRINLTYYLIVNCKNIYWLIVS